MCPDPVLFGKYQLLERLFSGAVADIYKAKSYGVEGFEKVLVVKRVHPAIAASPHFVETFVSEAKVAVTLTHANIVQVFDLGKADGSYFIAMEYVAGEDLGSVLERAIRCNMRMAPELAAYVVSELAKGLDYAHRRRDASLRPMRIVHGDVSPRNVLLSHEGEVKLTDFGMARARLRVPQGAAHPPDQYRYTAPEQALGGAPDPRSDIFSIGALLYEMVAGVSPLQAESVEQTLARARAGAVRSVTDLVPTLSGELAGVIGRALLPEVESRYQTAGELYEDLIHYLYGSGRRVGGHDVAVYLEELRGGQEPPVQASHSDEVEIEQVFAVEDPTEADTTVTPQAEMRRALQGDTPEGTDVRPALSEWRDVSVVLATVAQESWLEDLTRRRGGVLLQPCEKASRGSSVGGEFASALCVFGLGESGGRDAHEAASCALALVGQTPGGEGSAAGRAVVHSGRLLVDASGDPVLDEAGLALRREAADLLTVVRAGEVRVTRTAAALLSDRFRLGGADDRAGQQLVDELEAAEGLGRFVGRKDQLRRVGEGLAVASGGRLAVMGLCGEAGAGKSRLLFEIGRRLRNAGHDVGVHVAVCPAVTDVPLSAVQEMLRVVLGVTPFEAESEVRAKVERLRQLGMPAPQREAVARALGLAVKDSASSAFVANGPGQSALRAALARVAVRLAQDRLTIFAWDAAERMDAESRALLRELLLGPVNARVTMMFSYRSEGEERFAPDAAPGRGEGLPGLSQILVGSLSEAEVLRLIQLRLAVKQVDPRLCSEVYLKSGGNPLYVEEYLKALVEAGGVSVSKGRAQHVASPERTAALPRSLRGLVASRVGKLEPAQRAVLQAAVVVGTHFEAQLVARTCGQEEHCVGEALALLQQRGILRAEGETGYTFATDLVREVLYGLLPVEVRPDLHLAVAEGIEDLWAQRGDELVGVLAHHYREAGLRDRALDHLVRHAERLEQERSIQPAIDTYVSVIGMMAQASSPDWDRVLGLYERLGRLADMGQAVEESAERLGTGMELAAQLGRDGQVARLAMWRGRLLNKASRFEEGRRWLEEAERASRTLGDPALECEVLVAVGEAFARNGEYKELVACLERALGLARARGDWEGQVRCLLLVAPAHAAMGKLDRALQDLDLASRLLGESPDPLFQCGLLKTRSLVCHQAGDREEMIQAAREAMNLAMEYGYHYETAVNAHNLGEFYIRLGDHKRAFVALRFSHEVASEHGYTRLQWLNVCLLGFLDAIGLGQDQARERMQRAIRYAEQRGYVWDTMGEKYLLAMVEQKRGDPEAAARALRSVIELAEQHGHDRLADDAGKALQAVGEGMAIESPR